MPYNGLTGNHDKVERMSPGSRRVLRCSRTGKQILNNLPVTDQLYLNIIFLVIK